MALPDSLEGELVSVVVRVKVVVLVRTHVVMVAVSPGVSRGMLRWGTISFIYIFFHHRCGIEG